MQNQGGYHNRMKKIEERVQNYWTQRAHNFNIVRKNELKSNYSEPWIQLLKEKLPTDRALKILDVGTGTGFFVVLLSKLGHTVVGIDLTEAMLDEARENCIDFDVSAEFLQMDAQNLDFEDESFDAVITRNLTWTLPDTEKAYKEWYRVLKKGGILLNFDADYATNVRNQNQKASYVEDTQPYGHIGVTKELEKENSEITLEMSISRVKRPDWDIERLKEIGFANADADRNIGKKLLAGHDLEDAPMFMLTAVRINEPKIQAEVALHFGLC